MEFNNLNNNERLGVGLRNGSESAFEEIYVIYQQQIYHFILRYVRSRELAEDLTQEVFIKLWESRTNIIRTNMLKSYLYQIARNHTLNNLKRIVYSQNALEKLLCSYPENRNTTIDILLEKEYNDWIDDTLNSLTPRAREIFALCREQGKTYNEVAEELGVSRNAIKHQMVHVLKKLRYTIEHQLDIPLSIVIILFKI